MAVLKYIFPFKRQTPLPDKIIDIRQALTEFSKSLSLIVDLEQLKDMVISRLSELSGAQHVSIYLLNPNLNRLELAETRGFEIKDEHGYYFLFEEPLLRWFSVNETCLVISDKPEVFLYFEKREQKILRETEVNFIFPLIAMNRITGLVCLGSKSSGEEFSDTDMLLISTVLGQASLAFENAYLYQQQKLRLAKMYRADRLATLGQLAAGAAHEIRNPLTTIRSSIQHLEKGLNDPAKQKTVAGLLDEVDRINGIVEGLLSFSKPAQLKTERVTLPNLLQKTLALIETTATQRNIEVTLKYNTVQTQIKADASQLKQVFINVIMNAFEAMKDGGTMIISVELSKSARPFTSGSNGSFHIVFHDTGEGIPGENLENIFDPFYTTKSEGTGLGLSISYGIIQRHQGDIEIDSVARVEQPENHGTKVTIILPALEG